MDELTFAIDTYYFPPPVEIGLTDLEKIGGANTPQM
jgi:hypothetical protein